MDGIAVLDMLGAFVGFILTLMVFSYIFGDNVLFRLAIYVFIGVSAGYAAVIAVYNVIIPQMIAPLMSGNLDDLRLALPLLLGALLLFAKLSPRLNGLGTPVMAYLVGVGAAAVVGGAVLGTLFPQMLASMNLFNLRAAPQGVGKFLGSLVILLGTLVTLVYFHFGAQPKQGGVVKRAPWIELLANIGKVFIVITLGVLFAGVYAAALTALIERVDSIVKFVLELFSF